MAKAKNTDTIEKAVDLTQDAAKATLNATVKTAEVTEAYLQGMYKVDYDVTMEAMKVAKGYWDATSKIRQDWIKLFAVAGENLIDATAKMDLPMQKQALDMGKDMVSKLQDSVDNLIPKAKAASK